LILQTTERMISIIICSRDADISEDLRNNIRETIGMEYELIIVDRSQHNQSIFKAYNIGIDRSKYDLLCFIHDDILFHTRQWGRILLEHLTPNPLGLVGVAGGVLAPRVPAQWNFGLHFVHILQYKKRRGYSELLEGASFNNQLSQSVVTIDGVFMACRKELFKNIRFDELSFKGFHCYDLDISLQAHALGFENRIISNLLLEHFSEGKLDRNWIESQLLLWRKWRNRLPFSLAPISNEELTEKEISYMEHSFTRRMVRRGFSNQQILGVFKEFNDFIKPKSMAFAKMDVTHLTWIRLMIKPTSLLKKG